MLIQFLLVPLSLLGMWNVVNGKLTEIEVNPILLTPLDSCNIARNGYKCV